MTDAERLPPEELDAQCHCGQQPEGDWVFGTHCPVIAHRARSGAQWRTGYLELNQTRIAAQRERDAALATVEQMLTGGGEMAAQAVAEITALRLRLEAVQRERDAARETIAVLQREVEHLIASNRIDAERA